MRRTEIDTYLIRKKFAGGRIESHVRTALDTESTSFITVSILVDRYNHNCGMNLGYGSSFPELGCFRETISLILDYPFFEAVGRGHYETREKLKQELTSAITQTTSVLMPPDCSVVPPMSYIIDRFWNEILGGTLPEIKVRHPRYTIRVKDILSCDNLTVRERMIEQIGRQDFLLELQGSGLLELRDAPSPLLYKVLQGVRNEEIYYSDNVLWSVNLPNAPFCFLQVKDTSTGKMYHIKVPPDMQTVDEAKAWTFQLDEYAPVEEA